MIGFLLIFLIQNLIDKEKGEYSLLKELLYFPSGKFVEEISLGYNELFADLIWLRAVQYFGEHQMTDRKFIHLYHILDILTTLDKKFIHGYTFGGFLLESSAGEPENVDLLLHKGEFYNPKRWEIPFVRGFIYCFFRGDNKVSALFFLRASGKPEAPDMCKRFAGFTYQKEGDKFKALKLWEQLYRHSNNQIEKETALRYIKDMIMLIQMDSLNVALKQYTHEMGEFPKSIQQMVTNGFLERKLIHPWEDEYFYIDKENCRVWCTYLDRVKSPILMRMLESSSRKNEAILRDNNKDNLK
ncbi:hypothetical protein KAU34_06345 [candidate division WOR-3 bacterium]|nr:hypothetical protein [candidate division WOR-3 bacterium]